MNGTYRLSELIDLALEELSKALTLVARLRIPQANEITSHLMGVRLRLLLAKREAKRLSGR